MLLVNVIILCALFSYQLTIYLYIVSHPSEMWFQIIVLENGKVVEQGPHEFLLTKAGRYAQLWTQQNSTVDALDSAIKLEA
jgi:ABC-type multidrug transport system fused ATPase/permease subunit